MMGNMSEHIIKTINDAKEDFEGEDNFEELKQASEEYNELLKLGLIKRRGYNLLSINQGYIKQPAFNSQ